MLSARVFCVHNVEKALEDRGFSLSARAFVMPTVLFSSLFLVYPSIPQTHICRFRILNVKFVCKYIDKQKDNAVLLVYYILLRRGVTNAVR